MRKSLIVLAVSSMMSVPAFAQASIPAETVQPAKPQMVKKRVCQTIGEEDPYSRLGTRKVCRTIEVPAKANEAQRAQPAPAPNSEGGQAN